MEGQLKHNQVWVEQEYLLTCWATSSFLYKQSIRLKSYNFTSLGAKVKVQNPCNELVVSLLTLAKEGGLAITTLHRFPPTDPTSLSSLIYLEGGPSDLKVLKPFISTCWVCGFMKTWSVAYDREATPNLLAMNDKGIMTLVSFSIFFCLSLSTIWWWTLEVGHCNIQQWALAFLSMVYKQCWSEEGNEEH